MLVHPCPLLWASGHAFPRTPSLVSREKRCGRLSRSLRGALRAAGTNRYQGGRTLQGRAQLRHCGRRATVRGRQRDGSNGRLPGPEDTRLRGWIPRSCNWIRPGTGIHPSCRRVVSWSWAQATRGQRSPTRCPILTRRGFRAGTSGTSQSVPGHGGTGCSRRPSGSSPRTCSLRERRSDGRFGRKP